MVGTLILLKWLQFIELRALDSRSARQDPTSCEPNKLIEAVSECADATPERGQCVETPENW